MWAWAVIFLVRRLVVLGRVVSGVFEAFVGDQHNRNGGHDDDAARGDGDGGGGKGGDYATDKSPKGSEPKGKAVETQNSSAHSVYGEKLERRAHYSVVGRQAESHQSGQKQGGGEPGGETEDEQGRA